MEHGAASTVPDIVKKTSNCHMHVLQNLEFLGLGVNNILPKSTAAPAAYILPRRLLQKDRAQNAL